MLLLHCKYRLNRAERFTHIAVFSRMLLLQNVRIKNTFFISDILSLPVPWYKGHRLALSKVNPTFFLQYYHFQCKKQSALAHRCYLIVKFEWTIRPFPLISFGLLFLMLLFLSPHPNPWQKLAMFYSVCSLYFFSSPHSLTFVSVPSSNLHFNYYSQFFYFSSLIPSQTGLSGITLETLSKI
jgi:hypothetical protein